MLKTFLTIYKSKQNQGSLSSLGLAFAFLLIGAFSGVVAGGLADYFSMGKAERKAIQVAMIEPSAVSALTEEAAGETPDTIQNYIEGQIVAMFHRPDWQRRDQNKVVYQYRTESCVLDVYFSAAKEDLTIEDKTVEFVDFRKRQSIGLQNRHDVASGGLSIQEKKACMNSLLRQAGLKRRNSDVAAAY